MVGVAGMAVAADVAEDLCAALCRTLDGLQHQYPRAFADHHALALGMPIKALMAEMMEKVSGACKGKGGSMHMFSREKNFFGGHGIVGAGTAIGTGLGFAHKYKEDGGVAIAYMGDGASNQGQVAECYNMAALWALPVLFVIENNQYGMGTSVSRSSAGQLYRRGEGYGIPGEQVDGMDVLAVQKAAKQALDYIRSGNGPYILEVMTYRYRGHSMSDPAKYRTKEEVDSIKTDRDPIAHVKEMLFEQGAAEDEIKALEKEIEELSLPPKKEEPVTANPAVPNQPPPALRQQR